MPEHTENDTAIFDQQPPLRQLRDHERERLLRERDQGVLATVSPSGFPHVAPVLFDWDPVERIVRMSTRAGRVKALNLASNAHAALHVDGPDRWSFVVAEGRGEVSPVTTEPGDATGRELLSMFPQVDAAAEAEFLATQVVEQRVVLRLRVTRLYGDIIEIAPGDSALS
jgi:PPOX class probable F420-dependent enzyme